MDPSLEARLLELAATHDLSERAVEDLRALLLDLLDATRDPELRETVLGATRPASDHSTTLPGDTERFEFRTNLGRGGMGDVWRVWDRGLRRNLAMKTLRSDRPDAQAVLARFVAEAQLTSQLRHPAIVPVHELGQLPDGRVYYTMREVRGTTLATLIREHHSGEHSRGLDLDGLIEVVAKACDAVGYAHQRGVVHRDLKPANLMLGEFGEVQVIDWGVAKAIGEAEEPVETARDEVDDETRLGEVIGTPAYMAPEQAYGWNDRVDAASDVYALGAVLYEVLTGRPPYEPLPGRPVLSQVLEGPPPPVDAGPEALRTVIRRAMARERADRPTDATVLAALIRACRASGPAGAGTPPAPSQPVS